MTTPTTYSQRPVTDARYVPRSFSEEPKGFGRSAKLEWKPPTKGAEVELRAAQLQHEFAAKISRALHARMETVKAYCERTGQPYGRTVNMLNGRVLMRLEDIAAAQIHLDIK